MGTDCNDVFTQLKLSSLILSMGNNFMYDCFCSRWQNIGSEHSDIYGNTISNNGRIL